MERDKATFEKFYNQEITQDYQIEFIARLAYEINCIKKYDYSDGRPSAVPIKGDRMCDYAQLFGCSEDKMKKIGREVDAYVSKVFKNRFTPDREGRF